MSYSHCISSILTDFVCYFCRCLSFLGQFFPYFVFLCRSFPFLRHCRHFRGLRNYHGGPSQSLSPNPPGQGPTQSALPLVRCGVPVPATWDPPPRETI